MTWSCWECHTSHSFLGIHQLYQANTMMESSKGDCSAICVLSHITKCCQPLSDATNVKTGTLTKKKCMDSSTPNNKGGGGSKPHPSVFPPSIPPPAPLPSTQRQMEQLIKVGCCFFCTCCLCFWLCLLDCCVFGCFSHSFTLSNSFFFFLLPTLFSSLCLCTPDVAQIDGCHPGGFRGSLACFYNNRVDKWATTLLNNR